MSTLTTHTTATRETPSDSNIGLCRFNTTNNSIEVSDGTAWVMYYKDSTSRFNNFTATLDGSNEYLSVPSSSSTDFDFGTGEFSITFWMRITSRGSFGGLVYQSLHNRLKFQNADHLINLRIGNSEKYIITYNPNGIDTSLLNNWHHIAVIRSGTILKGYVDNVEYGSATATESFSLNGQQWGNNSGSYVGGQLDEIAVFNYGLSTDERDEIYNGGESYDIANDYSGTAPLSFYRCGDDTNDTSTSGTVTNGATIATIKNVINPGTHDMIDGGNGATYSNANDPV